MGKGFILWRGFAEGGGSRRRRSPLCGDTRAKPAPAAPPPRLRRVPVPFAHGGGEERQSLRREPDNKQNFPRRYSRQG